MREVFVTELVKNVLGPRDGITELIPRDPLIEYITGILAPIEGGNTERDADQDGFVPEKDTPKYAEDQYDEVVEVHQPSPSLDPRNIPSTMGLSFFVRSEDPRFEVCVTWSRYGRGKGGWIRRPSHTIFRIGGLGEPKRMFGADGKPAGAADAEISFHYASASDRRGIRVSMSVVNMMRVQEGDKRTPYCIFQPQIRVVCCRGTCIVPGFRTPSFSSDEDVAELVYGNRQFLAVGRLTSAVWKSIDPEKEWDGPIESRSPPFRWLDGDPLPEGDRKRFYAPDVRTEYVPALSVPTPDLGWSGEGNPELRAYVLADMYDPRHLRNAIKPIADGYDKWIRDTEKLAAGSYGKYQDATRHIIDECRTAHRRIAAGIDLLCSDGDARLAFCFANKAIDLQRRWQTDTPDPRSAVPDSEIPRQNSRKDGGLTYHPFQLAFILATLESALNKDSVDRKVCDLLWVPTGTGKTEAYLTVVAMVLAYRRLKSLDRQSSGAGVSVITRYTLRLLTIQQFRRTLSIIAAADYLRVYGVGSGSPAGWRPPGCARGGSLIWGSTPFSIGLWVGTSLTPNSLDSSWLPGGRRNLGAIEILKTGDTSQGDPAQIARCPACNGVLAVPEDGLPKGTASLHFVAFAENTVRKEAVRPEDLGSGGIKVLDVSYMPHEEPGFLTISMNIASERPVKPSDAKAVWASLERTMESDGNPISLSPASASRPGYFIRTHTKKDSEADYDFDIICPNPGCPLRTKWVGGSPSGKIHARRPDILDSNDEVDGNAVPDGNLLEDAVTPFRAGRSCVSDRIPLKAFTVDDQVYRGVPSIVVATVDKFARLPFKPQTGNLFGNAEYHHCMYGYVRLPDPEGKAARGARTGRGMQRPLSRPDMIIQDELHLLEGPLGSMVGAYESAVDFLSSGGKTPVKYIAATATISRPEDHVSSVLDRMAMVFPPIGIEGDRFFLRDIQAHQLDDEKPGRLYLGICCPGRGTLTPQVRMWSGLLQTAHEHRTQDGIDPFWTLTGYFNAVRELAGCVELYRQDIPGRMRVVAGGNTRILDSAEMELSSRTPSNLLPPILDELNKPGPDGAPDSLFTTSMFGTGVDIPRLGLMLVNGQPKTTTAYIQATGRVGRRSGALVVTLFNAARPRDLSHYEFFARHHLQLHRFIEPVTVHPFASGTLARAAGPVVLGMLRNMAGTDARWRDGPRHIVDGRGSDEIRQVTEYLENRSQQQPDKRRPTANETGTHVKSELDRWESTARANDGLRFNEYFVAKNAVVLGDQLHDQLPVVFENTPQSLRELEEEMGFET